MAEYDIASQPICQAPSLSLCNCWWVPTTLFTSFSFFVLSLFHLSTINTTDLSCCGWLQWCGGMSMLEGCCWEGKQELWVSLFSWRILSTIGTLVEESGWCALSVELKTSSTFVFMWPWGGIMVTRAWEQILTWNGMGHWAAVSLIVGLTWLR